MNKQPGIEFTLITDAFNSELEQLQEILQVNAHLASDYDPDTSELADWQLKYENGHLALSHQHLGHLQNIAADFQTDSARFSSPSKVAHELLIKAVGGLEPPERRIVDATAGLGTDSLLLALAGHQVIMLERSPLVAALLRNALNRAADLQLGLSLQHGDALDLLKEMADSSRPEIVYLDPMFPDSNKSALARKGLQALKQLLPPADREEQLLEAALNAASRRVVVKRPLRAPPLTGQSPGFQYSGKLIRYDCYAIAKL